MLDSGAISMFSVVAGGKPRVWASAARIVMGWVIAQTGWAWAAIRSIQAPTRCWTAAIVSPSAVAVMGSPSQLDNAVGSAAPMSSIDRPAHRPASLSARVTSSMAVTPMAAAVWAAASDGLRKMEPVGCGGRR